MQEKGFKPNAEDIYSVKKAFMKDTVIQFDSGVQDNLYPRTDFLE